MPAQHAQHYDRDRRKHGHRIHCAVAQKNPPFRQLSPLELRLIPESSMAALT